MILWGLNPRQRSLFCGLLYGAFDNDFHEVERAKSKDIDNVVPSILTWRWFVVVVHVAVSP